MVPCEGSYVLPRQFGGHVQQDASPVLLLQLPYPCCPVPTATHKPAHTRHARIKVSFTLMENITLYKPLLSTNTLVCVCVYTRT